MSVKHQISSARLISGNPRSCSNSSSESALRVATGKPRLRSVDQNLGTLRAAPTSAPDPQPNTVLIKLIVVLALEAAGRLVFPRVSVPRRERLLLHCGATWQHSSNDEDPWPVTTIYGVEPL